MSDGEIAISREQSIADLLSWGNSFIEKSAEWRKNSFETQWRRWQRNADGIYDPDISAKKESWQSRAFVPITPSHRENAQAQLFKTEVGPRPPLEIKARPGIVSSPELDQSQNIRDLILREREKSRYEIERNKTIEDKTTYGSGFARAYFETKEEDRLTKVPDYEEISVFDPSTIMRAMTNQRQILGYHDEVKKVITYRGVRFEHISIWDIFPDPKALKIPGSAIAYRYYQTYGDIVSGAANGYNLPEAVEKLRNLGSEDETPEDKRVVETDREIAESDIERTDYQKNLLCYELYARLPKKWVLINGEPIDDPESLIPARIRFHKDAVIGVEVNDSYDGEPPIYKDDYIPVAGQFYGRGIPEMLKDVQLVSNEEVNMRLDYKSITINPVFAVIEKSIVDPKDIDGGAKAGGVIRFKAPSGTAMNSIDQMFKQIQFGSLDRATFIEPQEWERWAQERTSVNRQTLGTSGQLKDANQTLGGMQILREAAGDKFAFIGMLSEFDFQYSVTRAYWKLIYKNYNPEDYALAIGPQRASQFIPMSPEEVENSYQYYPMGVYTMENKALRQARLQAIDAQFGAMPYFNRLEVLKAELQTSDEDPDRFIIPEADAVQIMAKAQEMAVTIADQHIRQKEIDSKVSSANKADAKETPAKRVDEPVTA